MGNKGGAYSQHGFTKGKSYLTNFMAFYNRVTGWWKREVWLTIYLDLYKGFDTVPHNILVSKMDMCFWWMDTQWMIYLLYSHTPELSSTSKWTQVMTLRAPHWDQCYWIALIETWTIGSSAWLSKFVHSIKVSVVVDTLEEMPSRGILTDLRGGWMQTSWIQQGHK